MRKNFLFSLCFTPDLTITKTYAKNYTQTLTSCGTLNLIENCKAAQGLIASYGLCETRGLILNYGCFFSRQARAKRAHIPLTIKTLNVNKD